MTSAVLLTAARAGTVPSAHAAATYTLFTLPDQGISTVYSQINGATKSADLTMHELTATTAETDLGNAAARGVTVRVVLDERQKSTNRTAYDYLNNHGVKVVWSSTAYYYTHEKSLVVDASTVTIMSGNLSSQYYASDRDFGVVDTDANDVAAVETVFNADFSHLAVTPGDGDDLIWSPTDSKPHLLALINGSTSNLKVYALEMSDPDIVTAPENAAGRGVAVQIVGENMNNSYNTQYNTLKAAGAHLSYYSASTGLYIHAKSYRVGLRHRRREDLHRLGELLHQLPDEQPGAGPDHQRPRDTELGLVDVRHRLRRRHRLVIGGLITGRP
jgi:phosphatidylserine/phosphatidylglycerophosphate/cardiolipin synthase-like enzyme